MIKRSFSFQFLLVCLLLSFSFVFSQSTILCPEQTTYFKIDDATNIPNTTDNGDGTVTLTHIEPYITDIFSNHTLYNFYQTFPNSNGELSKYYSIAFETKDLIMALQAQIPPAVFLFDFTYETTPISDEIITFLNGKKFSLTKYCSDIPEVGETCTDNEQTVPIDFNLIIEFNYNPDTDVLFAESFGPTPCGNAFYIAFKGGSVANTLQLWQSTPFVTTETTSDNPCHNIESKLYHMLDINCSNFNLGNLIIYINSEENSFILERENMVFSTDLITFVAYSLSIEDYNVKNIKVYESNSYLFISSTNIKNVSIEIFTLSGQKIQSKVRYQDEEISTDGLSSGLYFIKIFDGITQFQTYKFIKR